MLDVLAAAARWVRAAGVDQWPERFPTQLIEEGIERGEVFLAIEDGLVVGTVTLQWSDPRFWKDSDDDAGYVHRLALVPTDRGRGLGHRLLSWADEQVVTAGRHFLRLDCPAENSSLGAYYRAAGFEHQGDVNGEYSDERNEGETISWTVSLYERRVSNRRRFPADRAGDRRQKAEAVHGGGVPLPVELSLWAAGRARHKP